MSGSNNGKVKTGDAALGEANGKMRVHKGLKNRIYPNREQQEKLAVQFGQARTIFNWGLAQSRQRYPGYQHLAKQPPQLKVMEDTAWLKAGHSQVLQQTL